jgi:hypothetical protein
MMIDSSGPTLYYRYKNRLEVQYQLTGIYRKGRASSLLGGDYYLDVCKAKDI